MSHSFQRHCSAFLLVISRLRCIWSSSTEEPLNCPSSPYERGRKVCVYLTDQCNARREGLGLSLLCCVTVFESQTYTVCGFLVMKFTLAASPRHASCKHKGRAVVGPYAHITKGSVLLHALLHLWFHQERNQVTQIHGTHLCLLHNCKHTCYTSKIPNQYGFGSCFIIEDVIIIMKCITDTCM